MNDDLHNIDDLFKKALEDQTELPSPSVWDNIDKGLDKKTVISISNKYNKLKWAAAALLLFSMGMAMYALHIRIKNTELVKQSDFVNSSKNQHTQIQNKLKSTSGVPAKNSLAQQKINTNKGLEEKNSNTLLADKKDSTGISSRKNEADNITRIKNKTTTASPVKLTDQRSKDQFVARQNETKLLSKGNPSAIDSAEFSRQNFSASDVAKSKKTKTIPAKQQNISHDDMGLLTEKYAHEIPQSRGSEDKQRNKMPKLSSATPVLTFNNTGFINTGVLKERKSLPLKQRNANKDNRSALSATIFFSPDFVSTDVRDDEPRFRDDDRHEIEHDEKIKSSSTVGILLDYNTRKNWVLESGITFSTRNNYIQPKTIYARPDDNGNINYRFNCSAGYSFINIKSAVVPVSGDSINVLASKNTLHYIGVPVVLKYRIERGKFSIVPGLGISANFLTKANIQTTIATPIGNQGAGSDNIQGLKSTYFSGLVSMGAEYNLNKTFALTLIPTARFALSSINNGAPVKTNLNSIGLATGALIRF